MQHISILMQGEAQIVIDVLLLLFNVAEYREANSCESSAKEILLH